MESYKPHNILDIIPLNANLQSSETFKFIYNMFNPEIADVYGNLKIYSKKELQNIINFVFNKLEAKGRKNLSPMRLGELIFFIYQMEGNTDNRETLQEELYKVNKKLNFENLYAVIFWFELEYLKDNLDKYLISTKEIEKLVLLDWFCSLSKSIEFTFCKMQENRDIERANKLINKIYDENDIKIVQSFVAGGETRNKLEKSKAGKARANSYQHIKDYVKKEYEEIIAKKPKTSNNSAVFQIIKKMDEEEFNFSPIFPESRIDTFRKWVRKIRKGEKF